MGVPVPPLPPSLQPVYSDAASDVAGFAGGFQSFLQALATSEAQAQTEALAALGSPQVITPSSGAAAIYGIGAGAADTLARQGAAWSAFQNTLPPLWQGQLNQGWQQFMNEQNMQMAIAQSNMAAQRASAASSGGGGEGGMTANQAAEMELDWAKFEYEQDRDAMEDELKLAELQAESEDDEFEKEIKLAMLDLARGEFGLSRTRERHRHREATARIELSAQQWQAEQANAERRLDQADTRLDQSQARIEIANAKMMSDIAGQTSRTAQTARQNRNRYQTQVFESAGTVLDAFMDDWRSNQSAGTGSVIAGTAGGAGAGGKKPDYGAAFGAVYSRLRSTYQNPNGKWRFKLSDKQVRAKVNQLLAGRGIRPRGRSGARTPNRNRNQPPG